LETVYGNYADSLQHDEFLTMRNVVVSDDKLYIDITSDNIAYIRVCTFKNGELKDALYKNIDLFKDCAGFLIDVRFNRGGSSRNANPLEQLFIRGIFPETTSATPLYVASYGAYGQYKDLDKLDLNDPWEKMIYDIGKRKSFYDEEPRKIWIKDCPAYLSQPVVILSGCKTASAAEDFLITMRASAKTKIVGMTSFGSSGQPFMGKLPGGGQYGICTMKYSFNNVGIQPDIFVENRIVDHKNCYDAMFDKGLSVLKDMINCKK
jgi:C-terminal processing protease CtpA/Prc